MIRLLICLQMMPRANLCRILPEADSSVFALLVANSIDAVLLFLLFFFSAHYPHCCHPTMENDAEIGCWKQTHSKNIYDMVTYVVESSKNIYLAKPKAQRTQGIESVNFFSASGQSSTCFKIIWLLVIMNENVPLQIAEKMKRFLQLRVRYCTDFLELEQNSDLIRSSFY